MSRDFFDRIARLEREQASFAIATVVARRAPVSSHLGDHALVFADGRMEGFVGGSCSRDIVRRQALGAIHSRKPVLLQIRNAAAVVTGNAATVLAGNAAALVTGNAANVIADPSACDDVTASAVSAGSTTERVVIPMSCASEGAVDVYIEPRVPLRRLVVVGLTPVAEALSAVASVLDYAVVRIVVDDELRDVPNCSDIRIVALGGLREFLAGLGEAERRSLVAIVASQGHYDELALETLDAFDITFIGLVASRRRAATVFGVLAQQGIEADRIAMIRNPVGLDIGARTPGDVAVSILAEIIANSPSINADTFVSDNSAIPPSAVDPVCSMDVDTAGALYRLEHEGRSYFFCCAGCRASFSAEPARYLTALGSA